MSSSDTPIKAANRAVLELLVNAGLAKIEATRAQNESVKRNGLFIQAFNDMELARSKRDEAMDRSAEANRNLEGLFETAEKKGINREAMEKLVEEASKTLLASGVLVESEDADATDATTVSATQPMAPSSPGAANSRRGRPRGSRNSARVESADVNVAPAETPVVDADATIEVEQQVAADAASVEPEGVTDAPLPSADNPVASEPSETVVESDVTDEDGVTEEDGDSQAHDGDEQGKPAAENGGEQRKPPPLPSFLRRSAFGRPVVR